MCYAGTTLVSKMTALPFPAKTSHHHATWAGTYHSYPELYFQPQSVEEIKSIVVHARMCKRRLVVVGRGHSPSELTCTSAWMIELSKLSRVLQVTRDVKSGEHRVLVQAGIYLESLNDQMAQHPHGLTMPNLGSIDQQSIAGAIATGTHGSSLYHGPMAENVRSLRVLLSNGEAVRCSRDEKPDLFRAALVSLGGIGIVAEVEFRMVPAVNVEWEQYIVPLEDALQDWDGNLWRQAEFVRCWWMPYMRRMIVWKGHKTAERTRRPKTSWYGGSFGFHFYQCLLWVSNYVPRILPFVEWFIFGIQYRFSPGLVTGGVEPQHKALLMDCLYSQFVNEWAIPLENGPEAIRRLSQWMNGDQERSCIPFSPKGLWVHCPIEVRVSDGSQTRQPTRAFLDPTSSSGPTLWLNATLYRAYNTDPVCRKRYYEAFEWLMKDLGGRPHWAKNFATVTKDELQGMYGSDMNSYMKVRAEVDPNGLFMGAWHRKHLLGTSAPNLQFEEKELAQNPSNEGGVIWVGTQAVPSPSLELPERMAMKTSGSEESFDSFNASTESGEEITKSEVDTNGR